MTKSRNIIKGLFLAFVLLVLLALAYLGYRYVFYASEPSESAVPQNAVALIKIREPASLYQSINQNNKIWKELSSLFPVENFARHLKRLTEAMVNVQGDISVNTPLSIAYIQDSDSLYKFVYLVELPGRSEEQAWLDIIRQYQPHETKSTGFSITGNEIESVSGNDSLVDWYYTVAKGLFIASSSKELVSRCKEQAGKGGSLKDHPDFVKINETAGKKVDANVFFNYQAAGDILAKITPSIGFDGKALVTKFASWTGLDLIIKEDELLMSGYSLAGSTNSYLGFFEGQKPTSIEIPGVLPFNTASIFWIGKSDPKAFKGPARSDFISYGGALLESPLPVVESKEMAVVTTWATSCKASAKYILIRKDREGKIARYLQENSSANAQPDYKDYTIRKANSVNGKSIFNISGNYFTEHSDYFIFASNPGALQSYLNSLLNGKTLDVSENFKAFSDNISESGNIFFYLNIRNTVKDAADYLEPGFASILGSGEKSLKNLQGIAFQYSKLNGMFFTSFYLRHNEDYRDEDLSVWKTGLGSAVSGMPYLVMDHRADKLKIIAFDENHMMYLIDNYGNIIWQEQIAEKPLSPIYQVDYFKNGKIQYLFNTENYIYLFDLLGRTVENYPIKLNKKATGSLALFDYGNKKDYRLLVPSEDKVIYNYDIKGSRVKGWVNPKLPEISSGPAQHLVVGRKDYIIMRDRQNNLLISDRKGKRRITLKDDIEKAANSDFFVNKTNSKGIIITTNYKGHLTYIDARGNIQYTIFEDFSPDHFFLYEDFDNNGHNDFIYLDGNRLVIFDRFKKKIFEYDFPGQITSAPKIFQNSDGKKFIGIVLASASNLYLFDHKGDATITSGLFAETPFTVGSLEQDGNLNLVTGADNIIYNYVIE